MWPCRNWTNNSWMPRSGRQNNRGRFKFEVGLWRDLCHPSTNALWICHLLSWDIFKQEWSSQSKVEWKNVTQLKLVGLQWCDRPFRHLWPCSYVTRILMENILLSWFYECFPTVTTEDSEKQMSSTMIHTKSHWWFFSDLFRPRYLAYFRHMCLLYSHSSWGTAHVFREAHWVCINLFELWLPLASL